MTGYVIFDAGPRIDPEAMKPYSEKALGTVVPYGGKVIARTNNIDVRESSHGPGWHPTRILNPDISCATDTEQARPCHTRSPVASCWGERRSDRS